MDNFARFWAAWPANTTTYSRKGGRGECLRRWVQRGLDAEAEHIIAHVEWLKTTEDWTKQGGAFVPAPLVYLNQSRWDGAEIPESDASILARAKAHEERLIRESIERAGMAAKPVLRRAA